MSRRGRGHPCPRPRRGEARSFRHRYSAEGTMNLKRSSGILLHPTSLPGRFGIGDLGREAYRFVDWLASAGQAFWQIMPLGPTGYGDSPYSSFSAFAGNTNLVSPEQLVESGLLSDSDIQAAHDSDPGRV